MQKIAFFLIILSLIAFFFIHLQRIARRGKAIPSPVIREYKIGAKTRLMKEVKKNVLVLMSTYNGEKYLQQQIDSILEQSDIAVRLLVRDDESTDGTLAILDEYKRKGLLDYYQGGNLGPARSFMHLLQSAPVSEYYAFADQDDVWLPEKLSVAVDSLKEHDDVPALYFCQTQLVDENLNKIDSVKINPLKTFEESLIYHFVGGCTMVLNGKARNVVNSYNPAYIFMHDTWIYSVILAVGGLVHFDKTPHILYRQHGNNAVGQGDKYKEIKLSMKRFFYGEHVRTRIAEELKIGYYDMMPQANKSAVDMLLQAHTSLMKKFELVASKRMRSASTKTNILFWVNVLLNRI